jgi:putative hydrolase of the HAD superfamily
MDSIKAIFLDVGGVLLTNGWDTAARKRAAEHFNLDLKEMESRHHLVYNTYERGKMSLNDYLLRVIFYQERPFTYEDFFRFMKEQSKALPHMIDFFTKLKKRHSLKIACVSNEGRDLTLYRVKEFHLSAFVDYYIFSCFVHLQKPDPAIFRLALDVGMFMPHEVVYIDDRKLLADEAALLGIHSIHNTSYESTKEQLSALGLNL